MTDVASLDRADLTPDPIEQLQRWIDAAAEAGVADPSAMALATADADGRPSARTVLLRGLDARGIAFYTHRTSRKGRELAVNPHGAAVFHWRELGRQVCVTGPVAEMTDAESDAYFAGRPRGSRIGAWASDQGAVLPDRAALDACVAEAEARFPGEDIPRPPQWGGYRLVPATMEFWQAAEFRLHDRFAYERRGEDWEISRLSP